MCQWMLFTLVAMYSLTQRGGLDCQKRSRSGLCSKPPDLRSGDIALIFHCFAKVNLNKVKKITVS